MSIIKLVVRLGKPVLSPKRWWILLIELRSWFLKILNFKLISRIDGYLHFVKFSSKTPLETIEQVAESGFVGGVWAKA